MPSLKSELEDENRFSRRRSPTRRADCFRLELLGHHVDIRESAEHLRLALQDNDYSLAIIDTSLPDSNIRETMSKVRSKWTREQLPVLVISVDQSLDLVEQAVRLGADDYLLAPFDPQIFQSKVDRLLQPRTGNMKLARKSVAAVASNRVES